jgi:hypothetical protein
MHQAGPASAGPAFLHPAEPAPQPLQNACKSSMIKAKKISRTQGEFEKERLFYARKREQGDQEIL